MDKPPSLFKYQAYNARSLGSLIRRNLYFSPTDKFNDPFDCCYHLTELSESDLAQILANADSEGHDTRPVREKLDDPKYRSETLEALTNDMHSRIKHASKSRGVCCFSGRNDSLPMWSHYGDSHTGFCLEFDACKLPMTKARRVTYRDHFPEVAPAEFLQEDSSEVFDRMMCRKSLDWIDEDEWRLVHDQSGQVYCYGEDVLKAVYFGLRMDSVAKEVLASVVRGSDAKLFEMRVADRRYAVEACQIEDFPHK